MTTRSRLILVAAALLSGASLWVQEWSLRRYGLTLDVPEWLWIQLAVGWAFLTAGLVAERQRADSGTGTLLVVFGMIWIGRLVFIAPAIQWEVIGASVAFYGVLFLILYTFPSGRLVGWERKAAVAYLALVTVVAAAVVALSDFYGWVVDDERCCPQHLLLVSDEPELVGRLLTFAALAVAVVFALIVASLFRRWRSSSVAGRRNLSSVGAVLLPLIILLVVLPVRRALTEGLAGFVPLDPALRLDLYLQNGALLVVPGVILFELVRTRLSRARVADMIPQLGGMLAVDELEARLREALGDRSASLVFSREDAEGEVGVDGETLVTTGERALTRLDERVAVLHDPGLDSHLVAAAGGAAALSMHNAWLHAELRAQLREVRESRRRLIAAEDDVRRRVERDLHDGAQQRLVALSAALRAVQDRWLGSDPGVAELLAAAARETETAITELRDLARGVHPAILTQAGLAAAIATLADRSPIPVAVAVEARRFSPEIEATVYFVVAEGLANVFKHSAAGHAGIEVSLREGRLHVVIDDDGVGGIVGSGEGLVGLRDRVQAVSGTLQVESSPSGSRLTAVIPVVEGEAG